VIKEFPSFEFTFSNKKFGQLFFSQMNFPFLFFLSFSFVSALPTSISFSPIDEQSSIPVIDGQTGPVDGDTASPHVQDAPLVQDDSLRRQTFLKLYQARQLMRSSRPLGLDLFNDTRAQVFGFPKPKDIATGEGLSVRSFENTSEGTKTTVTTERLELTTIAGFLDANEGGVIGGEI
jgi:hypothetical protein